MPYRGRPRVFRAIVIAVTFLLAFCFLNPSTTQITWSPEVTPSPSVRVDEAALDSPSIASIPSSAPDPFSVPDPQLQQSPITPETSAPEPSAGAVPTRSTALDLPPAYLTALHEERSCNERFGIEYLENFRDSATEYCTPDSPGVTCFHRQTSDKSVDSMCIGHNAEFDPKTRKFRLGCDLAPLVQPEPPAFIPTWSNFAAYMYETGPSAIINGWINLDKPAHIPPPDSPNYTILVKREGEGNLWHCMLELLSMSMTMDVLQMSRRPHDAKPFFTEADAVNTQVVILDDRDDGPYFKLWSIFAQKPILRLRELPPDANRGTIIVPLAGGGNPLWGHTWEIHSCEDSALVRTFSHRVLDTYAIERRRPRQGPEIAVTFIDRIGTRVLLNHTAYFQDVESEFPHVTVRSIDFAAISFREQLEIIQNTDVLVGVHGAGLTHTMFLQPRSAVVEILPPELTHKGYRNLATLMDQSYFSVHSSKFVQNVEGDWHGENVSLQREQFMDVMDAAITSMYNKGERNYDAN